ncbi:hypothetical protein Tco_0068100 [Tanacetum coccineum]
MCCDDIHSCLRLAFPPWRGVTVHAKVLTKMLIPTHVPKVLANYVKPRLNNFVLKVIRNNQINLFPKPSTSANDLSDMDLKLKQLNITHLNKSKPSFHKQSHDHQDPPIDHDGEIRKKSRKDAGQSSFKSSSKDKAPMVHAQEDTPADQPQGQEDIYV